MWLQAATTFAGGGSHTSCATAAACRSFQPRGSQETAESKRRFQNLVNVTPLADVLVPIKPRYATDGE